MQTQTSQFEISSDSSLFSAIKVLELGAIGLALVVDKEKRLLGTLTDGDIRRSLLNGLSLDSPVHTTMNTNFHYATTSCAVNQLKNMMFTNAIRQIPILDEHKRVKEVVLLEDLIEKPPHRNTPVVIMAGGKGTRLRPLTENCPKPMICVGGKPMLEILLQQCIDAGFTNFYFSVNYLKEQIIDYFQDGSKWNVKIDYLIETQPLGTAGSLSLLSKDVNQPFLVMNGDILTRLNILDLLHYHHDHGGMATMCVRDYQVNVPYGVVAVNNVQYISTTEKPVYTYLVNAGVYVVDPKMLNLLQPNSYQDMPSFIDTISAAGHSVVVCPIHEYWIDIGIKETLAQAHKEWTH